MIKEPKPRDVLRSAEEGVLNEYQKISTWYIAAYVLCVITGLVMFIWPNLTLKLLGTALGIGMLVVGVVHIILYFTKDHIDSILHMDLTIGVVLAAFGAFMLMHGDFVGMAIPFGVGILLMIGGISRIQNALDMKRLHFLHWKIMLIVAIILIACGLVLIYNPFREQILLYFIAGSLILNGLVSILCVLLISNRVKKLAKGWLPKHMTVVPAAGNGQAAMPSAPPMPGNAAVMPSAPVNSTMQPGESGNGAMTAPMYGNSGEVPEVPEKITLEMPDTVDTK